MSVQSDHGKCCQQVDLNGFRSFFPSMIRYTHKSLLIAKLKRKTLIGHHPSFGISRRKFPIVTHPTIYPKHKSVHSKRNYLFRIFFYQDKTCTFITIFSFALPHSCRTDTQLFLLFSFSETVEPMALVRYLRISWLLKCHGLTWSAWCLWYTLCLYNMLGHASKQKIFCTCLDFGSMWLPQIYLHWVQISSFVQLTIERGVRLNIDWGHASWINNSEHEHESDSIHTHIAHATITRGRKKTKFGDDYSDACSVHQMVRNRRWEPHALINDSAYCFQRQRRRRLRWLRWRVRVIWIAAEAKHMWTCSGKSHQLFNLFLAFVKINRCLLD